MPCSGCHRELASRPSPLCAVVTHWRGWAEAIEATCREMDERQQAEWQAMATALGVTRVTQPEQLIDVAQRLRKDRAAVLREALDAVPQSICTHGPGCEESTCPLVVVNAALRRMLETTETTA